MGGVGEALTLAQHLRGSGHLDETIRIGERGLRLKGRKGDVWDDLPRLLEENLCKATG